MLPFLLILGLLAVLLAMYNPPPERAARHVLHQIKEFSKLHRFVYAFVKSAIVLFRRRLSPPDFTENLHTARQFLMLTLFGRGILHS